MSFVLVMSLIFAFIRLVKTHQKHYSCDSFIPYSQTSPECVNKIYLNVARQSLVKKTPAILELQTQANLLTSFFQRKSLAHKKNPKKYLVRAINGIYAGAISICLSWQSRKTAYLAICKKLIKKSVETIWLTKSNQQASSALNLQIISPLLACKFINTCCQHPQQHTSHLNSGAQFSYPISILNNAEKY